MRTKSVSEVLPVNVKYVPRKGPCLFYSMVEHSDVGRLRYEGGAISLDLCSIKPCSMGNPNIDGKWFKILSDSEGREPGTLFIEVKEAVRTISGRTTRVRRISVSEAVIEAAITAATESTILA
jgi:hypothetical protein